MAEIPDSEDSLSAMSYSPIEETTSIAIPDRDVLDQPPRNRTNATSVSDSETTSTSSEDDSRSDHLASRRNRSALKFKHHAVPQSPSGNTDHCVGAEKDTLHVPEPSHEESTQTQATTLSHASTTASEYGKETLDVQSYAEDKRQITAVQRTQNLPTLSSKSKSASSNTSPDVIQAPAADSNVPRSKSVEETDSASTVRLQYAEGDASSETTRDHETPTSHRESPPPLETNSTNQVEPRPKEDPRRRQAEERTKSLEATLAELTASRQMLLGSFAELPAVMKALQSRRDKTAKAEDSSQAQSPDSTHLVVDQNEEALLDEAKAILKRHITLLHSYNEMKDVGTGLIGMIAESRGERIRDIQDEFGISKDD